MQWSNNKINQSDYTMNENNGFTKPKSFESITN